MNKESPTHSITLADNHSRIVTWREHQANDNPEPKAFDLQECSQQLQSIYDKHLDTRKVPADNLRSPEEAHFWAAAIVNQNETLEASLTRLAEIDYSEAPRMDDLVEPFWRLALHGQERPLFKCLATALSPGLLVEFMMEVEKASPSSWESVKIGHLFREIALPYLSPAEIHEFREIVRPQISGRSIYQRSRVPCEFLIAAAVGCHPEIADLVAKLPEDIFEGWPSWDEETTTLEWVLFGLPDREHLIAEARRLGIRLLTPESIKAWLALTGWHALDVLADTICWLKDEKHASKMAQAIHLVRAPEMALPALRIATRSKAKDVGKRWIENHPDETAAGLISAGMGRRKHGKLARDYLIAKVADKEFKPVLLACGGSLGSDALKWLSKKILPEGEFDIADEIKADSLADIIPQPGGKKLPGWFDPGALHAVNTPDGPPSEDQLRGLCLLLKSTPLEKRSPRLVKLKQRLQPAELDRFAASLLKLWLNSGANMRDKWVVEAAGHLGGEHCSLLLTSTIRRWAGEGLHMRAKLGLQCLRAMDNDAALSALSDIAARVNHKGVRSEAQNLLHEVAKDRGLTALGLEDRTVPRCGIDNDGRRAFVLGIRRFEFVAGSDLRPWLRDAHGKLFENLPAARRDEDPILARQTSDEWKAFKANYVATITAQTARLKRSFVTARRWTPDEFTKFVLGHPIMRLLSQQLIFASHNEMGELTATFRIAEDWSLADMDDGHFEKPSSGDIRIAHPVYLGAESIRPWEEILADHAIIPLFEQLDRAVATPDPGALDQTEILFGDLPIDPVVKNGMLKRKAWKYQSDERGDTVKHLMRFESAQLIAYIHCHRKGLSLLEEGEKLHSVYFIDQRPRPGARRKSQRSAIIRQVDRAIVSEVLRMVRAIIKSASVR